MSKYTRFSRSIFKFCDVICQPLSNWGRQNPSGLVVKYDVAYGEEKCQTGDIYYPENADKKLPAIVNIHGGGFVGGDKIVRNALSIWFAKLGFLVFNINYCLAPDKMFPSGPHDCVKAYNWLCEHAEAYNIDTSRIVVSGDSAGGYMASAIAVSAVSKELQECYKIAPAVKPYGAVLNCGIYDVATVLRSRIIFDLAPKLALDFCGITLDELDNYEHKKYLSTFDYVTAEFPKSFIASAKRDIFVPSQGENLAKKLRDLGVYVEHYEGKRLTDNHVFPLMWDKPSARECNEQIKQFLIKIRDGEI